LLNVNGKELDRNRDRGIAIASGVTGVFSEIEFEGVGETADRSRGGDDDERRGLGYWFERWWKGGWSKGGVK